MRYLLSFGLFLLLFTAKGQSFPSQEWKYGEAVLTSGDTIKGIMRYNLQDQFIQLSGPEKITTFNASQLSTFFIKHNARRNRVFYSLPTRNKAGYTQPILFEMLRAGDVSLLGREYIAITTAFTNFSIIRPMDVQLANLRQSAGIGVKFLAYNLYLAKPDGKIVELGDTQRDLFDAFGDKRVELKKYIRKMGLNLYNVYDYALVLRYYNSINDSNATTEGSDT